MLLHYLTLGLPGIKTTDFGSGYLGWPEIAVELNAIENQLENTTGKVPILAATSKWGGAAALAFHHPENRIEQITAQNLLGLRGSMWEFWFDRNTNPDRPVILYNIRSRLIDEAWLEGAVINLGPLQERPIYRNGAQIQTLYYRIADGFRPEQVRYPDRIPE
jgi:dolichol-phosphate mannosyltransferase